MIVGVPATSTTSADVLQGDIYWVEIRRSETKGSEQYGRRPFIVVSRTAVNRSVKTVVVVPMSTTVPPDNPPFRIVIPVNEIAKDLQCTSVLQHSVAKTDQVRAIDKVRLLPGNKIGKLSQTAIIAVTLGLAFVFDIR